MSEEGNKTDVRAAKLADLTAVLDAAVAHCTAVTQNTESSLEDIGAAENAVVDAQANLDAFNAESPKHEVKEKKLKVKFKLSPTGRFGLAYSEGDECKLEAKQAHELVAAEYAEFVK